MGKTLKERERWKNAEAPNSYESECFPPLGITRLKPHHFVWWAKPAMTTCCCCCCCCCHSSGSSAKQPAGGCSIDLQLEPNTFGPGKSLHIVAVPAVGSTPAQYFAEFYLTWKAVAASQLTVDLELISGPVSAPQLLADNRGPSDRYLFGTYTPGSYLFRATATDSQGNTCFDTLQVDLPRI